MSIAGASSRQFTYDAAGNVIYDARSGVGYGYGYDAANRMDTLSIDGIRRGNAPPERFLILLIAGGIRLWARSASR